MHLQLRDAQHTQGAQTHRGMTMAFKLCAGRPGGEIAPPKGYKYEAQVEFTDHVTPANPEGSLAAAAIQEVRNQCAA